MTEQPSLAAIKHTFQPGQVYEVTNHYITRRDHSAYGTTRRTVTRTTTARLYMAQPGLRESGIDWPKASQVRVDPDGTIHFYGGGTGQQPADLFLTLRPAQT